MVKTKSLKPKVVKKTETIGLALGPYFKEKRVEAGMSIGEIAAYLEVSINEIECYEKGTKPIQLDSIFALSNCLNISPEEIVQMLSFGKI